MNVWHNRSPALALVALLLVFWCACRVAVGVAFPARVAAPNDVELKGLIQSKALFNSYENSSTSAIRRNTDSHAQKRNTSVDAPGSDSDRTFLEVVITVPIGATISGVASFYFFCCTNFRRSTTAPAPEPIYLSSGLLASSTAQKICLLILIFLEILSTATHAFGAGLGLPCIFFAITLLLHAYRTDDEYKKLRYRDLFYVWSFYIIYSTATISGITIPYLSGYFPAVIIAAISHPLAFCLRIFCLLFEYPKLTRLGLAPPSSMARVTVGRHLTLSRLFTWSTIISGILILSGGAICSYLTTVQDESTRALSSLNVWVFIGSGIVFIIFSIPQLIWIYRKDINTLGAAIGATSALAALATSIAAWSSSLNGSNCIIPIILTLQFIAQMTAAVAATKLRQAIWQDWILSFHNMNIFATGRGIVHSTSIHDVTAHHELEPPFEDEPSPAGTQLITTESITPKNPIIGLEETQ